MSGETVGGPICLQFAYEYPDRTRSVTLCGAPYRLTSLPDHFARSSEILLREGVEAWATGNGSRRFGDKADPEMVRWYHHEMGKTSARSLLALFDYLPTVDLTEILPQIRVPTLVFAGLESGITPPDDSRFIADQIPGAQLVEIEGAPTQLHVTHQDVALPKFQEFLRGLS